MPWGALAGAAVGIIGGVMQSNAASDAASAQEQAAQSATAEQEREFNYMQGVYQPGRNLGYGAMGLLAQLYGLPNPQTGKPSAGGTPQGLKDFFNSSIYQFPLQQGEQAIRRQGAATGNLYAPQTSAALGNYAEGVASQGYNNYVQQLFGMAGIGQSANAGTANAAAMTGNNISSLALSAGNANASGILGSAGAWSSALNTTGNLIQNVDWSKIFGSQTQTPSGIVNAQNNPSVYDTGGP